MVRQVMILQARLVAGAGLFVVALGATELGAAPLAGGAPESEQLLVAQHAAEPAPGAHPEGHHTRGTSDETGSVSVEHGSRHGAQAHASGHHEPPGEINWAQGFLGESAEGPFGFAYRPEGTPPPLLALLLNTALVLSLLFYFGRGPVREALVQRRAAILKGIEEAAKMRADAETRLQEYEERLRHLDDQLEELKKEMRTQGEAERAQILAEARAKRERMEQDARRMVELELKAAREDLQVLAVRQAIQSARELLLKELASGDHQRILDQHLTALKHADFGGAS